MGDVSQKSGRKATEGASPKAQLAEPDSGWQVEAHPAPSGPLGAASSGEAPNAAEMKLIDDMVAVWEPHVKKGVELRHKLGTMANGMFGVPPNVQPRGEEVLKFAADRLGMHPSDLSRARNFARYFPRYEDFTKQHPDITTWSKVKELLAELSRQGRRTAAADGTTPEKKKSTEKLRKDVMAKLKVLREEIMEVKDDLTVKEIIEVEGTIHEIADELESVAAPLKKSAKETPAQS